MMRFVVEPAVALKWFIPEKHSASAARLLDGGCELLAPDTIIPDAGKIITLKTRSGELTREEGVQVLNALGSSPIWIEPSEPLLEPAFWFSSTVERPLGDGICMALAVALDCRLVTASRKLFERVQGTPFATHLKWLEDVR